MRNELYIGINYKNLTQNVITCRRIHSHFMSVHIIASDVVLFAEAGGLSHCFGFDDRLPLALLRVVLHVLVPQRLQARVRVGRPRGGSVLLRSGRLAERTDLRSVMGSAGRQKASGI